MQIRDLEKASFIDFAKSIGRDPDELAKRCLERIYVKLIEQEIKSDGIIPMDLYGFDFGEPSIDTLIDITRRSAETYSERVIRDLVRFTKINGKYFQLDIDSLKRHAKCVGISTSSSRWLYDYLKSFPIISFFTLNFEAYVAEIRNKTSYVVLSRSLIDLMQFYLIPLTLNMIYPDDGVDNLKIQPIDSPRYSYEIAAGCLNRLAKQYLGLLSETEIYDEHELFRVTPAVALLGHYWHTAMLDFVLLHEYSHLLFCHSPFDTERQNEVMCDAFALNILLHKSTLFNAVIKNEFAHFKALTPVILFYFILLCESLTGLKLSKIHPHPFIRIKYMYNLARHILIRYKDMLTTFDQLFLFLTKLFSTTIQSEGRAASFSSFVDNLDESFLDGYEFICIPTKGPPIIYTIDPKSLKRN